jgi:hypothetical protein
MKWLLWLIGIGVCVAAFVGAMPIPQGKPALPFGRGEQLTYRAKFGWFTVGSATTTIDKSLYRINQQPCYRVEGAGETASWVSVVAPVKDTFGAYIDTTRFSTQVAYRKLEEGDYRFDEVATFDHQRKKVDVKVRDKETGQYGEPKQFDIPENAKDIIGGFMALRQLDFSKLRKNDTITLAGFFEDKSYFLKIMYKGHDVVQTKVGRIACYKLVPVMPDNKLFDGENSITVWISQDGNQIPVKMQAKMFVGHTGLELEGFRGLRHQLKIQM